MILIEIDGHLVPEDVFLISSKSSDIQDLKKEKSQLADFSNCAQRLLDEWMKFDIKSCDNKGCNDFECEYLEESLNRIYLYSNKIMENIPDGYSDDDRIPFIKELAILSISLSSIFHWRDESIDGYKLDNPLNFSRLLKDPKNSVFLNKKILTWQEYAGHVRTEIKMLNNHAEFRDRTIAYSEKFHELFYDKITINDSCSDKKVRFSFEDNQDIVNLRKFCNAAFEQTDILYRCVDENLKRQLFLALELCKKYENNDFFDTDDLPF